MVQDVSTKTGPQRDVLGTLCAGWKLCVFGIVPRLDDFKNKAN